MIPELAPMYSATIRYVQAQQEQDPHVVSDKFLGATLLLGRDLFCDMSKMVVTSSCQAFNALLACVGVGHNFFRVLENLELAPAFQPRDVNNLGTRCADPSLLSLPVAIPLLPAFRAEHLPMTGKEKMENKVDSPKKRTQFGNL